MTFIRGLSTACLAGALGFSGAALAVTDDGNVGPTSTGHMDVSVLVPDLALIENIDPISLLYDATGDAVGSDDFCIWSTSGAYNVLITSQYGTNEFLARGTLGTFVSYDVVFDDSVNPANGVAVTENVALAGQVTTDFGVPPGCAANNAVLEVTFPETNNLLGADSDAYTDELTLTVAPE